MIRNSVFQFAAVGLLRDCHLQPIDVKQGLEHLVPQALVERSAAFPPSLQDKAHLAHILATSLLIHEFFKALFQFFWCGRSVVTPYGSLKLFH